MYTPVQYCICVLSSRYRHAINRPAVYLEVGSNAKSHAKAERGVGLYRSIFTRGEWKTVGVLFMYVHLAWLSEEFHCTAFSPH